MCLEKTIYWVSGVSREDHLESDWCVVGIELKGLNLVTMISACDLMRHKSFLAGGTEHSWLELFEWDHCSWICCNLSSKTSLISHLKYFLSDQGRLLIQDKMGRALNIYISPTCSCDEVLASYHRVQFNGPIWVNIMGYLGYIEDCWLLTPTQSQPDLVNKGQL